MKAIAKEGDLSQGVDGGSPTALTHLLQAKKTFFGGKRVGLVGDQYEAHTVGRTIHKDNLRQILPNDAKTYFEGIQVARTDDLISDGDKVGTGDAKFSVK